MATRTIALASPENFNVIGGELCGFANSALQTMRTGPNAASIADFGVLSDAKQV